MIYLGDQWPASYRGLMFMCNTHGRRVNIDSLSRRGASFVATYQGDFLVANQSWFRGVTILYGPDGAVYLSDWTDDGECHDQDGVHRSSGRIFKITHGAGKHWRGDLGAEPDAVLLDYHHHKNAWFPRQSRLLLHERAAADSLHPDTIETLHSRLSHAPEKRTRLRALWTLHVIGGLDEERLLAATGDAYESVRAWAIRLLVDHAQASDHALSRLVEMASREPSSLVRLYLTSAAQRVPARARHELLLALAGRAEDHGDKILQRMLWYALEPALADSPFLARHLATRCSLRILRLLARRLAEPDLEETDAPEILAHLFRQTKETARLRAILDGIVITLGKHSEPKVTEPWYAVLQQVHSSPDPALRQRGIALAIVLGHQPTLRSLIASVRDEGRPLEDRLQDLNALLVTRGPSIDALCQTLLHRGAPRLRAAILPSLPRRNLAGWRTWLLDRWETLTEAEKPIAVEALSSHLHGAKLLAHALSEGRLQRTDITASQVQKMIAMRDPELSALLEKHWGSVQPSSQEKRDAIERYRALIRSTTRKPDLDRGKTLYTRACAACHRLFGQGGTLCPDLTGSDRGSLDYLLNNIIDPSASVASDYRLTVATARDGRVITGALVESDRSGFVIRTLASEERLAKEDVIKCRTLKTSLMPEGLFHTLTEDEVIHLIGYLQNRVSAP